MSVEGTTWPERPKPRPVRLLLNTRDAAAALAVSERTLWGLTAPRGPIPCVSIGRAVRYDVADLRAFIDGEKGDRAGTWQRKAQPAEGAE